jgi:hypothetical protein
MPSAAALRREPGPKGACPGQDLAWAMDEDDMVVLGCSGQATLPQMVDNVGGFGKEISVVGGNHIG